MMKRTHAILFLGSAFCLLAVWLIGQAYGGEGCTENKQCGTSWGCSYSGTLSCSHCHYNGSEYTVCDGEACECENTIDHVCATALGREWAPGESGCACVNPEPKTCVGGHIVWQDDAYDTVKACS